MQHRRQVGLSAAAAILLAVLPAPLLAQNEFETDAFDNEAVDAANSLDAENAEDASDFQPVEPQPVATQATTTLAAPAPHRLFGPGRCMSLWRSGTSNCVVQTRCANQDISNYMVKFMCATPQGNVIHLFDKGSFDSEETFDTFISCTSCLEMSEEEAGTSSKSASSKDKEVGKHSNEVGLASAVQSLVTEVDALKASIAESKGAVERLNQKIFPEEQKAKSTETKDNEEPAAETGEKAETAEKPQVNQEAAKSMIVHSKTKRSLVAAVPKSLVHSTQTVRHSKSMRGSVANSARPQQQQVSPHAQSSQQGGTRVATKKTVARNQTPEVAKHLPAQVRGAVFISKGGEKQAVATQVSAGTATSTDANQDEEEDDDDEDESDSTKDNGADADNDARQDGDDAN